MTPHFLWSCLTNCTRSPEVYSELDQMFMADFFRKKLADFSRLMFWKKFHFGSLINFWMHLFSQFRCHLYYPYFLLRAPLRIWEGVFIGNSGFHSLTVSERKLHLRPISQCTSLNSTVILLYYHYYYLFFIYLFAVLSFCYFIIVSRFNCFK